MFEYYRSVYYYHCNHSTNSYEEANKQLDEQIRKIFDKSKGRYGSPKIAKVLNEQGIKVSQKRVVRGMKLLGLRSIIVKKFNHSGMSKTDATKEYPNLLEQNFSPLSQEKMGWGYYLYLHYRDRLDLLSNCNGSV